MRRLRIGVHGIALVALVISAGARAGVEITGTETVASGPNRGKAELKISIEGDWLRMDRKGKGKGQDFTVLFDSRNQVLTFVSHRDKNYIEMTPEDVKSMKKSMSGMMSMMESQLKNMPPAQRAKMEKMMQDKGLMPKGGAKAPKAIKYTSVSRQSKTGKWNTSHYEARVDGAKVAEYRIASWSELGVAKSEFRAMEALQKYGKEMMDGIPQSGIPNAAFAAMNVEMNGFPVMVVNYEDRVTRVSEILYESVQSKSIGSSAFAVPAGYSKRAIGAPGGRRGKEKS